MDNEKTAVPETIIINEVQLLLAEKRLTSVFDAFSLADLVSWQKTRNAPQQAAMFH